jgi:hypothetical protein
MLVLGLLLSLVVAEALLQAGALVVRWMAPPPTPLGSDPRVVFFGDSNTYGVYVQETEDTRASPERLRPGLGLVLFERG